MLALALALGSSLAVAQPQPTIHVHGKHKIESKHKVESKHRQKEKELEQIDKEHPFGVIPKGPLQIIISIDQQRVHLYSDGAPVADVPVATGVPEHPTPIGVFSVIEKQLYHESNIYSAAPMPFMQRITWSGLALHEGIGLGHRASHGCVRMPREFAARLWLLTRLGARVIIARSELKPAMFADARLFVHRDKPPPEVPDQPASSIGPVKTAQTIDGGKTVDGTAEPDGVSVPTVKPANPELALASETGAAAAGTTAGEAKMNLSLHGSVETVPVPSPKPDRLAKAATTHAGPIAILVSRKASRIYVRQGFKPLFDARITIEHPKQLIGTHVFTAMEFQEDGATLRWNVISFPGERPQSPQSADKKPDKSAKGKKKREPVAKPVAEPPPPETPQGALARIDMPQDVKDRISELIVPGSSLIISDEGLGAETGEGTDFIVAWREDGSLDDGSPKRRPHASRPRFEPAYRVWEPVSPFGWY